MCLCVCKRMRVCKGVCMGVYNGVYKGVCIYFIYCDIKLFKYL